MSALVGFTGPRDTDLLLRMQARLAHRGKQVGKPIETAAGSFAVLEWPNQPPVGTSQSGAFQYRFSRLALAGYSFNDLGLEGWHWKDLRGSFSAALLNNDSIEIARDPTGCQSLYFGKVGKRWLFASEPKAITAERNFQPRIRDASIVQYLACSFVPGQHTMLEDLYEVEAGHVVELQTGQQPVATRSFNFEKDEWHSADTNPIDEKVWVQRTRKRIEQAVAERLVEPEPVVFLSGGLDSSIIAAELARQSTKPIQTFAIHFGEQFTNELPFARAVAERIGSRHEEVLIAPKDFLPRMRQMIWHLDEPIGDPITQPNYELASYVHNYSRYIFNGEGGDPLFGGPKNLPMMLGHWYGGIERPKNFREIAYLASYRRAYDEWSRLLSDDFRKRIQPDRDLESFLKPFFETDEPKSFLNKLMAINIRLKGANLILPKVDRMLAAHGLTPASPLFDDQLTRLSFQLPPKMKLRHGIEKWVLKRAYEDLLPKEIIERPKSGMRVPVHFWFKKDLRKYARKILSKRNVKRTGIFDPDRVQQLLEYNTEDGPGRYGLRLWMLITFEIWRSLVVDREPV